MKYLFALLAFSFVLGSCSISQEYFFNKDFSGTYKMEFDLSGISDIDEGGADDLEISQQELDSLKMAFENIEGISKVNVETKNSVIYVAYSFKDLNALNKSLENFSQDDLSFGDENKFAFENNVFSYNFSEDNMGETPADSVAQMMSFLAYNVKMTFEKKIKTVSNGELNAEENSVTLEGDLGEIATSKKSLNLEVTFK